MLGTEAGALNILKSPFQGNKLICPPMYIPLCELSVTPERHFNFLLWPLQADNFSSLRFSSN